MVDPRQPEGQQSRANPKDAGDQAGQVRPPHAVLDILADGRQPVRIDLIQLSGLARGSDPSFS